MKSFAAGIGTRLPGRRHLAQSVHAPVPESRAKPTLHRGSRRDVHLVLRMHAHVSAHACGCDRWRRVGLVSVATVRLRTRSRERHPSSSGLVAGDRPRQASVRSSMRNRWRGARFGSGWTGRVSRPCFRPSAARP